MALSRRRFTKEVNLAAIQRLDAGASIAEITRALEVTTSICCTIGARSFATVRATCSQAACKRRWDEGKVAQLESKVGQQTLELDFLKGCLQRIEEERLLQALTGKPRPANTSKVKSKKDSPMTIEQMCALGQVNRAGFYDSLSTFRRSRSRVDKAIGSSSIQQFSRFQ